MFAVSVKTYKMLAAIITFIRRDSGEPGVSCIAFQETAALEEWVPRLIVLPHGESGIDSTNSCGILQCLLKNFFTRTEEVFVSSSEVGFGRSTSFQLLVTGLIIFEHFCIIIFSDLFISHQ